MRKSSNGTKIIERYLSVSDRGGLVAELMSDKFRQLLRGCVVFLGVLAASVPTSEGGAQSDRGQILILRTSRVNSIELITDGSRWRANTYWYSVIPGGNEFIMLNDTNKKYCWLTDQIRMTPERRQYWKSFALLTMQRTDLKWSPWKKAGSEQIRGTDTVHYRRTGFAAVHRVPQDGIANIFQDSLPSAASTTVDFQNRKDLLRQVTSVEDIWIAPAVNSSPSLARCFRILFGCDTSLGIPVQNQERMTGIASNGRRVTHLLKYLELTKISKANLVGVAFAVPKGYAKVNDRMQVMIDDEGAEGLLYRIP